MKYEIRQEELSSGSTPRQHRLVLESGETVRLPYLWRRQAEVAATKAIRVLEDGGTLAEAEAAASPPVRYQRDDE